MLTLSRKKGQRIQIGDNIVVTIVEGGSKVKVGIEAPRSVPVFRAELLESQNTEVSKDAQTATDGRKDAIDSVGSRRC